MRNNIQVKLSGIVYTQVHPETGHKDRCCDIRDEYQNILAVDSLQF
jgi:hypothetical protein